MKRLRTTFLSLALVSLTGCASTPDAPAEQGALERYNRSMYAINDKLDRAILRPVAKAYDRVTPDPAQTAVRNFFGNLGDLWIGTNNFLQGKPAEGVNDWARFVFNSTWGLGGLIDIASQAGLPKHNEDFGQTLGVWGVGEGPFIILPLLGPSTLRDAAALPLDSPMSSGPLLAVNDRAVLNSLFALDLVSFRATLLGADQILQKASFDEYAYMRDFYLQQRRYKVADGKVTYDYDLYDDDEEQAEDE